MSAPRLYAGGLPAAVLAAVLSSESDPRAGGETIASIAEDISRPYDHIKRAVVGLRAKNMLYPSSGYSQPLRTTVLGRRAIRDLIRRRSVSTSESTTTTLDAEPRHRRRER